MMPRLCSSARAQASRVLGAILSSLMVMMKKRSGFEELHQPCRKIVKQNHGQFSSSTEAATGKIVAPPGKFDSNAEWESHWDAMLQDVRMQLPKIMTQIGIPVKDIEEVPPADIHTNMNEDGRNEVRAIRDAWSLVGCRASLETAGMYEGNGSVHWFDVSKREVSWNGNVLIQNVVTPHQVAECSALWTEEYLVASSDDENQRRFRMHVTIPSACHNIDEACQEIVVDRKTYATFKSLPVFGGRAVLISYYEALHQTMSIILQGNLSKAILNRLVKLWEACSPFFLYLESFSVIAGVQTALPARLFHRPGLPNSKMQNIIKQKVLTFQLLMEIMMISMRNRKADHVFYNVLHLGVR